MSNLIQHSSASDSWMTPLDIIERCRSIAPNNTFDLDPASTEYANSFVRASKFFTVADNGLAQSWGSKENPSCVFLNPPSGRLGKETLPGAFWKKMICEYANGNIHTCFYIGFSLNQLCTFQDYPLHPLQLTTVILRRRLHFISPDLENKSSPSHHNFVTVLSKHTKVREAFYDVFYTEGYVVER